MLANAQNIVRTGTTGRDTNPSSGLSAHYSEAPEHEVDSEGSGSASEIDIATSRGQATPEEKERSLLPLPQGEVVHDIHQLHHLSAKPPTPGKKKAAAKPSLSSRRKIKWNVEPYLSKMKKAIAVALSGRSTSKVAAQFGIPARTLRRYVANERHGVFPENGSGDEAQSPDSGRASPQSPTSVDFTSNGGDVAPASRGHHGSGAISPDSVEGLENVHGLNGTSISSKKVFLSSDPEKLALHRNPKGASGGKKSRSASFSSGRSTNPKHHKSRKTKQKHKKQHRRASAQSLFRKSLNSSPSEFIKRSSKGRGRTVSMSTLKVQKSAPAAMNAQSDLNANVSSFALLLQACQQRAPSDAYHTHVPRPVQNRQQSGFHPRLQQPFAPQGYSSVQHPRILGYCPHCNFCFNQHSPSQSSVHLPHQNQSTVHMLPQEPMNVPFHAGMTIENHESQSGPSTPHSPRNRSGSLDLLYQAIPAHLRRDRTFTT